MTERDTCKIKDFAPAGLTSTSPNHQSPTITLPRYRRTEQAANKGEDGGVGTGPAYSQPSYSQVVKTRATEAGLHGPSKASQRPPKPRYPQRQGILRPFVLEPSGTPIGAP